MSGAPANEPLSASWPVSERPETLVAALQRATDAGGLRFLDRRERETRVGWPEIRADAERVAAGLQALGIERGERVVIVYATEPDFFAAFFGIQLAGGAPAPVYPPVRLGRIDEYHARTARMIQIVGARLVLASARIRRVLGQTIEQARPALGCKLISELPAGSARPVEVDPDDLAMVQFSSGTTVDPKPVALSHRAVTWQSQLILDALARSFPEEVGSGVANGASWLPLYHDMGLIGCVFPALLHDAHLSLMGPELFVARPAAWLRMMSRYGALACTAPNFAYALCVERIKDEELEGVDLSRWRVAMNGAEPVAPETLRAFTERFARWGLRPEAITPVYGLSEASLAVTFSDFKAPFTTTRFDRAALWGEGRAERDPEGVEIPSVGYPLPGFALEIRAPEGAALPEGRVGRVWTRGPSLMDGYLENPEATARALVDGWLDTGDLGFLFEGQLYLTGRAKDVIILRGRNYSPHDLEHAVAGLPGLRAGCVAAVSWRPEGAEGEALALFLEHSREATPEEIQALPEAASKQLRDAIGLRCDLVLALEPGSLPRTTSGKIRRGEALRRHLAGELTPPDAVTPFFVAGVFARSAVGYLRSRGRSG